MKPLTYEVLVDRHENPRKCTIQPLGYRPDFALRKFGSEGPIGRLTADVLLHIDGESLDTLAQSSPALVSVALVDCHWKRCASIMARLERPWPRLARIPDGFQTAYPRKNLEGKDPEGGLATIEALFIAAAFLGSWDETLLREYHFGTRFLEANHATFARFGLLPRKDVTG